jgi:hypothetical protein
MRHRFFILMASAALISAFLPATNGAAHSRAAELVHLEPGVGGFMSDNLTYVATLPTESPGVSARVVQVGTQRRLYVSSAKNLSVYNVTDPAVPLLMGTLDTHNWENEDIAVSKDGTRVLMSDFEGVAYLIVISVTDLPGGLVAMTVDGVSAPGGNHTIECVDDPCDYAYGSTGKIYDLTDPTKPTVLSRGWKTGLSGISGGHHVTRDAAGLVWTDTSPILALDVTFPTDPRVVARSDRPEMTARKTAYQHNNIRPFAELYTPRVTPEDIVDRTGGLRPGELLLGEGETNGATQVPAKTKCDTGSGPFTSYDLRNFDHPSAAPFRPIEVFRPINGSYDGTGDPAVNELGCSGHWFDVGPMSTPDQIVTTNAWYEHGTRLFTIDGHTGDIEQLGYFQPVVGSASAAYWVGSEYIYVADYERGIDILKFDAGAPTPTRRDFRESWLAKLHTPESTFTQSEQYFCALAQRGGLKPSTKAIAHI